MAISLITLDPDCLEQIFLRLDFNQLNSISRTCRLLDTRVEEFKRRYPDEYGKKLNDFNRFEDPDHPLEIDDEILSLTDEDGNFLVDFDDADVLDFMTTDEEDNDYDAFNDDYDAFDDDYDYPGDIDDL